MVRPCTASPSFIPSQTAVPKQTSASFRTFIRKKVIFIPSTVSASETILMGRSVQLRTPMGESPVCTTTCSSTSTFTTLPLTETSMKIRTSQCSASRITFFPILFQNIPMGDLFTKIQTLIHYNNCL